MKRVLLLITLFALILTTGGCSMISFIQQENQKQDKYLNMTSAELSALSDEDLLYALYMRAVDKANSYWNLGEGAKDFPKTQKAFFVVYCFDTEFQNGGLCRFFVNSSRSMAPLLSESLKEIGAAEHSAMFDKFVTDYEIDIENLISFIIGSEKDFDQQKKRYPFVEFDAAFQALPPVKNLLITYARAHLDEL